MRESPMSHAADWRPIAQPRLTPLALNWSANLRWGVAARHRRSDGPLGGCYCDVRLCSVNASAQSSAAILSMDIRLTSSDGTRGVLARMS